LPPKCFLGLRHSTCENDLEQVEDGGILELDGLGQAVENCGDPGALFTPGAHADFTEDDQRAECGFGVIVGGGTAEQR
jgi:hypothetical protein